MEIIYRKPGRGKTTKLLQECIKLNKIPNNLTYILVADRKRALFLSNFAKQKGYIIPFPITVSEFLEGMRGTFIRNILIDDAEDVLKVFIGNRFNVPMITMSKIDKKLIRGE